MSDNLPATGQQLALLGDPIALRTMTDPEFRGKASQVASFLRQGLAGFKALVGVVLAEACHRWGEKSEDYRDLRKQYLELLKVDGSTLARWRTDGAKRLNLALTLQAPTSEIGAGVIETKVAEAIEVAGPEPTTPESSAAVPTTVSEHGPDAGEGFVALPGSGQPQSPDGAKGTGVRAESQIRHDGEQARPSADAQAATGLSSSPSPPVQTPECGPKGASAVKGPELVEPEEQSGATGSPNPSSAPTSSGSSRSVGAAGRSTSARPAGPSVAEIEAALALICEASDTAITNSNPFLKAKAVQKLSGPQQLTSEFHQVSSESQRLISEPSKPETNGATPRPFAGPIPKVGKR